MKVTSQISSLTCLMPTLLPSKYDAEIDFLPIEADAPARRHGDSLVVEWVVEVGQAGVGPC